jgi:ribosomal protein S18 acetylase RimI-like enzyme
MLDFAIVEYDHSYAQAVADMWNRSGDSWGGYNVEFTADAIRHEEESSAAVNTYIAVLDDEVVGYIKLAEWTQGEGALYVAVLNVRPDLHGKKIGKALLLTTIERTTELGWPRLDLHTWGGNTKAVPLYKRSGFFWEERDKEVYCVNYIPEVIKNELVVDFFQDADWYQDSTRPIRIEPDGRKENEFTYFTYSWKKGEKFLNMEYARKGRGLCGIDRNEYKVTARVENLDLVFGRSYTVRYEFENRGEQPLEISIRGRDDKNIRFDFAHTATVADTYVVEAEFHVGEIERPQSEWKTHPRVAAQITIDGKSTMFQVGIAPRFPADVTLSTDQRLARSGVKQRAYLDVASNVREGAVFAFELPESDFCRFSPERVERRLAYKERVSIPLTYTAERGGVYSRRIPGTASIDSGDVVDFSTEIGFRVPFLSGTYHGTMPRGRRKKVYTIGNGPFSLSLVLEHDTHLNGATLRNDRSGRGDVRFLPPKLGKPYSEEFIRTKPESVVVDQSGGDITMRAKYRSGDFPGIILTMCFRLSSAGVVERWFELENTSSAATPAETVLLDEFRLHMERPVLPYREEIVEARSETSAGIWSWNAEKLTENWLFSRSGEGTAGFFWAEGASPRSQEWSLNFERSVGVLGPGERVVTEPLCGFVDTFASWRELREFAAGDRGPAPTPVDSVGLQLNGGNPFVSGSYQAVVVEAKQKSLVGDIEIASAAGSFSPARMSVTKEQKLSRAEFELPASDSPVDLVTANLSFNVVRSSRCAALFRSGVGSVTTARKQDQGQTVLELGNGLVTVRSAPDFSPGLYSCRIGDTEWLDSSFPVLGPRDWWNPWMGGLTCGPLQVGEKPLLAEPRTVEPVERKDCLGNSWQGLASTVTFETHEDYKGLTVVQYFMLLPGAPVLLSQFQIKQNTGTQFFRRRFGTTAFVGGGSADETVFSFLNAGGNPVEVVSGQEEWLKEIDGPISVRQRDSCGTMIAHCDCGGCSSYVMTNKRTSQFTVVEGITCSDGDTVWGAPLFLILTDVDLSAEGLRDLAKVRLG